MSDGSLGQIKDVLTIVALIIGGSWAILRFGHTEWLRIRGEIPSLEGNSSSPEIFFFQDGLVAVNLRWIWRNVGTRPVYIDDRGTVVEIYRLAGNIGDFVDPRQHSDRMRPLKVGDHHPLEGYGFYMLEPSTTSSLLTVPILPVGEAFIARHRLYASGEKHRTGKAWQYSWERWQVFRTDLPSTNTAKETTRTARAEDKHA